MLFNCYINVDKIQLKSKSGKKINKIKTKCFSPTMLYICISFVSSKFNTIFQLLAIFMIRNVNTVM